MHAKLHPCNFSLSASHGDLGLNDRKLKTFKNDPIWLIDSLVLLCVWLVLRGTELVSRAPLPEAGHVCRTLPTGEVWHDLKCSTGCRNCQNGDRVSLNLLHEPVTSDQMMCHRSGNWDTSEKERWCLLNLPTASRCRRVGVRDVERNAGADAGRRPLRRDGDAGGGRDVGDAEQRAVRRRLLLLGPEQHGLRGRHGA